MVHSSKNLQSSIFGCTSLVTSKVLHLVFSRNALLLHLKRKAQLPTCAFVCKHQFVVWHSVLSEQFDVQAVICLRWVIFSPGNVDQLITYYYMSGKFEHIYHEKRLDNNEKTRAQTTWLEMMLGEGILDQIGIVHWRSLPNAPILWITSVTNCTKLPPEICFGASQYNKCSLLVSGWRHNWSLTSQMDFTRFYESPWGEFWLLNKRDKWSWPAYFNTCTNPVPPIGGYGCLCKRSKPRYTN